MGRFGGLESFVLTIANHINTSTDFTCEVVFKEAGSFLLHTDLRTKISEHDVDVSFCRRFSLALIRAVQRADIVHLQNPCPDVVFFARLFKKPLLINVINHNKRTVSLHQLLWRTCLNLAQRRLYISDFVRRSWEGVRPRSNSQVVFPICELSPLSPLPVEMRSGFVFVSRWIENKGLDTLIKAYSKAGLNSQDWPLRLLGDGPLRPRILELLQSLGLENSVEVPGFLGEYDKADHIRRSRFAVIPPHTSEDFGLVAIEARHLGLPCLITRDGGLPEAAGEYSLSCPPADIDALSSLLLQAASMSYDEYSSLATCAHISLEKELVKPQSYEIIYRSLLD
jgi:glycosyltransferase involved in cell wall biosynthesis